MTQPSRRRKATADKPSPARGPAAAKSDALAILQKASNGIVYRSESEASFTPFSWGKADGDLTPQKVAKLAGASASATVEESSLADFFKNLTEDGVDDADKYRQLQKVLGEQLPGAKVFRIGRVNLDVYIVGTTRDGQWAGLKTQAVET